MTTPEVFIHNLRSVILENVFNPYTDRCTVYDVSDAPFLRAKALNNFLRAALEAEVDALWIGRDLGHRGGRRTGLALTDDIHLNKHANRWAVTIERPTTGSMVSERTAAIIWSTLQLITLPVFLWNVFPFHPHEENNQFTNRPHKRHERAVGEQLLSELIDMLRPRRIVAIGNDAAQTARRIAPNCWITKVRHPSYGGQRDFVSQIAQLYDLRTSGGPSIPLQQ